MKNHSGIIRAMQSLDPWRFWLLWIWLMCIGLAPFAVALAYVLHDPSPPPAPVTAIAQAPPVAPGGR